MSFLIDHLQKVISFAICICLFRHWHVSRIKLLGVLHAKQYFKEWNKVHTQTSSIQILTANKAMLKSTEN